MNSKRNEAMDMDKLSEEYLVLLVHVLRRPEVTRVLSDEIAV